jgi:TRAP-type mannitol/chloroaromatic compound transport system permease small subunit
MSQLSEALGKVAISLTLVLVAIGFYNVAARYVGRFIGRISPPTASSRPSGTSSR